MRPAHDADAGGDPQLLAAKRALREEVWADLAEAEAARFPGARGRIPNFVGAEAAADRLQEMPEWAHASTMKANPDSPQWPVRTRALTDGMRVYLAVPRLADPEPFLRLDPEALTVSARKASSIKGASTYGAPAGVADVERLDLVVVGCVAVDADGARLGKGGGFADLELAIASEAGLVDDETVVVTTVHPRQLLEPGRIPVTAHDIAVDLVVTPDEVLRCARQGPRTAGVRWEELTEEKIAAIPVLKALRER